jgi:ubiquinone/menaquinone biosynthesis C-methylase UbiE
VLDVACGTGVVARTAADRMGGRGRVAGLDRNQGMLAVAGRLRPDLEWHEGDAAELPFADASFDAVLCQSALMFFPDRVAALREMARVAAPGGTVAVQVWDLLEAQEGYGAMYAAFSRQLGPGAGSARPGSRRPARRSRPRSTPPRWPRGSTRTPTAACWRPAPRRWPRS